MLNRLPAWFRQRIPDSETFKLARLLDDSGINTVCREAKCPNIAECFKDRHFTFMILGNACTRRCRFCNVASAAGKGMPLDPYEPQRIAEFVKKLGIKDAVITSVTRDDLSDGGAGQFAKTIELIRKISKDIKIEVLIPDFKGAAGSLKCVVDAGCDILGHNIETSKRLYPLLRPQADYDLSLGVLKAAKKLGSRVRIKSSMMLGLGEKQDEVVAVLEDLKTAGCDILALGQYLAPSPLHYPVQEFVAKERFLEYELIAFSIGFGQVLSGPLVRSSYRKKEVSTCTI